MNNLPGEQKPVGKADWLIAAALIVAGTAISVVAVAEIRANQASPELAQATQLPPSSNEPQKKNDAPAESKPGGTRPTTPAPEPASPGPDEQKAGGQPARPAEKYGPPVQDKDK